MKLDTTLSKGSSRTAQRGKMRGADAKPQAGIAILEALIAILIFSIGVLGIVGLQARSVQGLGEAGFRSQAVQHADDLIAQMWTSDPGTRKALYQSVGPPGPLYQAWANKVTTGSLKLPGAAANMPTVVVNSTQTPIALLPGTNFFTSDVTITIQWLPPGAPAGATPSQYVTTARILEPQL
jgi:type IV pilus assembly protein PilV